MGEVYLADDTKLGRQVALKFLSRHHAADESLRRRFTQEARAAAALNHPNIITIYEVSEYQGRPFIAMEFVNGPSLNEIIEEAGLPYEKVVDITDQICEGLAEAHKAGLIHRDIKPSNLHIDEKGRVIILDFGLARIVGEADISRSDSTSGTVNYMSPEQVRGEKLTAASDLFSLGVVMYKMISGRLPFAGDYEAAVLYSTVNENPQNLSKLRPDIPPCLEEIVSRLLQKIPSERYQSAHEVQHDLQNCLKIKESVVKKRKSILRPVLYIIPALLILVILFLVLRNILLKSPENGLKRQMVAVLPFENLGPPEDNYFADGMTDAVTTNLAKYRELGVISRASSMQYKNSSKNLRQIGAELGVAYILTGTIHWDKSEKLNRIRINTSLVKVKDDTYLWAQTYQPTMEKVFSLQSEIADDITRVLSPAVDWANRPVQVVEPTENLEAYDLYLRGNEYFNRTWDKGDIENAILLYKKAVELDSNFALAYAMLARGQASMFWEYFDHSEDRKEAARQAAEKALAILPDLAEGHLAMGYYYYHCHLDYPRALAEFEVALKGQPNNSDLYNAIGAVERREGDLQHSVQNFSKALELDPRSHLKAFDVGLTYGMMRQYQQADKYLNRTITLAPDWPLAYIYKAWLPIIRDGNIKEAGQILQDGTKHADLSRNRYYWWILRVIEPDLHRALGIIALGTDTVAFYLQKAQFNRLLGNYDIESSYADSARMILEKEIPEHSDDPRLQSYLGLAYAGLRRPEDALVHGEMAVKLLPASKEAFDAPFWVVNLAEIMVIVDEHDAAVGQLEFLLTIPGFVSVPYLKIDPLWIPLRENSGFQKLISSKVTVK